MIKNKFSELLGKKRLKVSDISRMTGISQQRLYDYYHDRVKVVNFDNVSKLCWALECSIEDLFEYIPDDVAKDIL